MFIDLKEQIIKLKHEKNALLLAHLYQRPEIQEIADFVGDSYYLSKLAQQSDKDLIIFCGVKFMAESAKILSPNKTVLLPALDAGCPMADMADVDGLLELKAQYPNAAVVCYINSSTEVKAHCDVAVTSSSAIKIINNIPNDEIIFLPDRNLGGYIAEQMPNKKFILWDGYCITHRKVDPKVLLSIKEAHDDYVVLVHPECDPEVRELADFIGSTSEIIDYATKCPSSNFVVVTEVGILHKLKEINPNKNFFVPGKTMTCMNMKKTTLQDVYNALKNNTHEINIEENLRQQAHNCLIKMHQLSE